MKKPALWKRLCLGLLIPVLVLCVLEIMSIIKGVPLFAGSGSWLLLFRAIANVTLTTFALSINLDSGRFDFSLGSMSMLSATIAGSLAIQWNLSAWPTLLLCVAAAAFLGLFHGAVYVITRIPPIIVSLGMALFFEGTAYAITGGKGVSVVTRSELISFSTVSHYILLTAIAVAFVVLMFDYTRFGANYRSLLSGQKIAVETGIKEIPNALGCYAIAGGLMGIVGFISMTNTGTVQMSLNFGSIGIMFTAFLPMFIGGWISRWLNKRVGYMLGAAAMALISLSYARFDTASAVQSIVSALLLVLFLIYLNNETTILSVFKKKQDVVK